MTSDMEVDASEEDVIDGNTSHNTLDPTTIYSKLVEDIKTVDGMGSSVFKYSKSQAQDNSKSFESHEATPGLTSRSAGQGMTGAQDSSRASSGPPGFGLETQSQ
jgi:hypothetical protein